MIDLQADEPESHLKTPDCLISCDGIHWRQATRKEYIESLKRDFVSRSKALQRLEEIKSNKGWSRDSASRKEANELKKDLERSTRFFIHSVDLYLDLNEPHWSKQ